MRFYKEVWGIIWEFNSIGDYISFCIGRLLGIIISVEYIFLLSAIASIPQLRILSMIIKSFQQVFTSMIAINV